MKDCIEHTVYRDKHGYGRIHRKGQDPMLHRQVWVDAHGPIPMGMVIRHKCDNPACVNIEHLEIGTQQDNVRDRDERGRTATGLRNGRAKVTPEMIEIIRYSPLSSRELGAALGISHTSVQWARRGLTTLSRLSDQ